MLLFMYKTASKRKLHLSWEEIDFMNLYLDVRLARITKKKLFFVDCCTVQRKHTTSA